MKNGKARPHSGQAGNGRRASNDGAYPVPSPAPPTSATAEQLHHDIGVAGLSATDQKHLAEFEKKLQMVRDRVAGVVLRYSTGYFLWGPPGVSKSYTVVQELHRLEAHYHLSNSRMTGRGLFDTLTMYPDSIHVLEDVEQMLFDKNALGVLRSALWGQRREGDHGPQERWITWSAHRTHLRTLFTGGIILMSNRPLLDLPELQALKTRLPYMLLQPGDNELRALMRRVASEGFEHDGKTMDPEECRQVCEHVIRETQALHRPLDMRVLRNAFCHYLQWCEGDAGVFWKDQVAADVRERPTVFRAEVSLASRAARKEHELAIAREIMAIAPDDRKMRRRLWEERTGKHEKSLYRRLAELRDD